MLVGSHLSNHYFGESGIVRHKCDSDQSAAKALLAGAATAANGYRSVQEQLREIGIVMSKRGETLRINYFDGFQKIRLLSKNPSRGT